MEGSGLARGHSWLTKRAPSRIGSRESGMLSDIRLTLPAPGQTTGAVEQRWTHLICGQVGPSACSGPGRLAQGCCFAPVTVP